MTRATIPARDVHRWWEETGAISTRKRSRGQRRPDAFLAWTASGVCVVIDFNSCSGIYRSLIAPEDS